MKRILSLLLCLVLTATVLPSALAEETGPVGEQTASVVASGTCGANLSWTLTDDGTLTISVLADDRREVCV